MRVNWLLPMLWAGFAICEVYKHNLRLVWPASIALESEIAAKLLSQGCFTSVVPRPSASSALLTFEFAYKEKLGGGQRSSGSTQGGTWERGYCFASLQCLQIIRFLPPAQQHLHMHCAAAQRRLW